MTNFSRKAVISTIALMTASIVAASAAQAGQSEPPQKSSHGAAKAPAVQSAAKSAADGHGGAAAWGYGGAGGPGTWGSLSRDYHACAAGLNQSPIDLAAFDGASVTPVDFDYRLTPVAIVNNGHTIQLNYAPGSGIRIGDKRYELLQFHFHAPSEHSVEGRQAPMEAHFVHKGADGSLAVIGVLMAEGEENMALREFWGLMPRQGGQQQHNPKVLINARDLLPHAAGYYRYMGSLTTPPCSEGVNWYVMAEPVPVAAAQVEQFRTVIGANARPVQPVNNRLVLAPR